jgi:hypothetical protein
MDLAGALLDLDAEFNRKLGAWVIEPPTERRVNPATGKWEDMPSSSESFRVEFALRDLRGVFELEWQTSGESLLPRRRVDVTPASRTSRGWTTPKWEDPR